MTDVVLLDLGLGNLHSVERGLERAGGRPERTTDPARAARSRRIVLPGVGAFADGMARANAVGLRSALQDALAAGARVLGICLGMQLLFEEGEEGGPRPGLGLLPGRVRRFPEGVMVPHTGWRQVAPSRPGALLERKDWFYFAHSYVCDAAPEDTAALVDHGRPFAAAAMRGELWAVQFHPEKSQRAGERLLARFLGP